MNNIDAAIDSISLIGKNRITLPHKDKSNVHRICK